MSNERQLRAALGGVVFVAALAVAAFGIYPHPSFSSDGYTYAVRMLVDRGLPLEDAVHRAQEFWQQQPIATDPLQAHLFRGDRAPLYWDVFKPRVIYPFLAAMLYPLRGFYGMLDISAFAYGGAALAIYYLALQFAGALPSLAVTLGFMLYPGTLENARATQTDMLAMFFSTLCIVALVRIARGGDRRWIVTLAAACLLLVFTRPAFYMILGGALGLAIGSRGGAPALRRASLVCVGIAAAWAGLYIAVSLGMGTPSFSYVVADARDVFFRTQPELAQQSALSRLKNAGLHFSPDDPLAVWYGKMVVNLVLRETIRGILFAFPLLGTVGLWVFRRDPAFGPLVGVMAGGSLVLLLDQWSQDMTRVLEVPMLPVIAVGLLGAASALYGRLFVPNEHSFENRLRRR